MFIQNKQSGVAPVALIIAVVLVAAAAGGYFLLNRGGSVSVSGVPALTLNPNCKQNDPDLCKFINSFKVTNNYSAKSVITDKAGKRFDSTFESAATDKSHIVYVEAGKETFNVITIGDTTYTKDNSDGKWWKQVQPKASKQPETQTTNIKDEITKTETPEDKTTYKKIGMEACGSRQCFKYQVIDPANTDTTDYLWFDNREYLLRKERSEGKDGSITDTELSYSGVNINVPSPTKNAAPDQVILPTGGTMSGIKEQGTPDLKNETPELKPEASVEPAETPESDTSGEN